MVTRVGDPNADRASSFLLVGQDTRDDVVLWQWPGLKAERHHAVLILREPGGLFAAALSSSATPDCSVDWHRWPGSFLASLPTDCH
jgi:hypothetical protein